MTSIQRHNLRAPLAGFTLVEASISIIIVAVMLGAAVQTLGVSARLRLIQKQQFQGQALAKQLMDEIMQLRYIDPTSPGFGPETGETRANYNDVDDYNGYLESPPTLKDGTAITGYTGWKRSVTVTWADANNPANTATTDSGLKRILITVTSPTGRVTKLTALRSKNSPYEDTPTVSTSYISWIGVTLQVGSDTSTTATGGVSPLNQIP